MVLNNRNILLSNDHRDNILEFEEQYYSIESLKNDGKGIKGGNGIVFQLNNEDTGEEFVIKISLFPQSQINDTRIKKRILRFEREIEALYVAKNNPVENVIEIQFHDIINIDGESFQYYVMQKCECTLREFLENPENDLSTIQKVFLCQKILKGIMGLHEYKIYHRDIKHDNILLLNGEPLIADLGLADYRDSDIWINEKGELIGPTGWFSPEAINKYLVEKTINKEKFDCKIDKKSEVFQLGKLFWYIMQGNLPIGQILIEDFLLNDQDLFNIIYWMLEYSKNRRSTPEETYEDLEQYIRDNN